MTQDIAQYTQDMSMSNDWYTAVDQVTNQVLTFLQLNENEKKKNKNMMKHA